MYYCLLKTKAPSGMHGKRTLLCGNLGANLVISNNLNSRDKWRQEVYNTSTLFLMIVKGCRLTDNHWSLDKTNTLLVKLTK